MVLRDENRGIVGEVTAVSDDTAILKRMDAPEDDQLMLVPITDLSRYVRD